MANIIIPYNFLLFGCGTRGKAELEHKNVKGKSNADDDTKKKKQGNDDKLHIQFLRNSIDWLLFFPLIRSYVGFH